MNKKVLIGVIISAIILVGAIAVGATSNLNKGELISLEEAVKIATEKVDGYVDSHEFKENKDGAFYLIEVEKDRKEYDVRIDAYTGEIVSVVSEYDDDDDDDDNDDKDKKSTKSSSNTKEAPVVNKSSKVVQSNDDDDDDDDKKITSQTKVKKAPATTKKTNSTITREQAIAIAKKAVGGGKVIEVGRDEDDGRIEYEVELKTDKGEVEVEIDGKTGKIIEIDYDYDDDDDDDDDRDDD